MKQKYVTEDFCKENNFKFVKDFMNFHYEFKELKIYFYEESYGKTHPTAYYLQGKALETYKEEYNPRDYYYDEEPISYLTEESEMEIKNYLEKNGIIAIFVE